MSKVVSADEAASMVPDGATVVIDGSGGGVNEPGRVLAALKARFERDGHPRSLTVVHPSGMGDAKGGGIDYLASAGMVSKAIGGHWQWCPGMQRMASAEQIEAYCLPQGVLSHMFRVIAGKGPGVITRVGLGTFVDPRIDGGRLNASAKEKLVELMEIRGEEFLFYPAFNIDVTIIRGTCADEMGNVTMESEGLFAETLSAAQAARNSGGIVIAQVKFLKPVGTLDPRQVKVPGIVVDAVVVDPEQRLSFRIADDPSLTGAVRVPQAELTPLVLNERKVIARRAAAELRVDDVANLGFGMPDGVATILAEEGLGHQVHFTLEQGHIGGVPATGDNFGMARNQYAMIDAGYQFDFYDGGGLDVAVLSFAQVDPEGNVNVSKFGGRIAGIGGFVNISQGAKRVVFIGTLRAGSQQVEFRGQGITVLQEAKSAKFVSKVDQISFSGTIARRRRVPVTYVTERAVFELEEAGLVLTEIAPGLDLERDVLAQMDFRPRVSDQLQTMDERLFSTAAMGLRLQARVNLAKRNQS